MSDTTSSAGSRRAPPEPHSSLRSFSDSPDHVPGFPDTDQSSVISNLSLQASATSPSRSPARKDHKSAVQTTFDGVYDYKHGAKAEFTRISDAYPLLQSTGCTPLFCQAGRMIKTNEPRVGKGQPLSAVLKEAADFLRQLRNDGIIGSDELLQQRLMSVIKQINHNSRAGKGAHGSPDAGTGGHWDLTLNELEYGLRLAWKHSQKCIMRSEYKTLEVCDLRHERTSKGMGSCLVEQLEKAFGCGDITPTVFVFPARELGQRGPMIWNSQLLSFAGYRNDDGTITGDPANAELTTAIIDLGWEPPALRSRWDMLPIVTMAEGDDPFITEIPEGSFPLVHITHPRYRLQFDKLGLRWVPAPALSRLGFDIGGVQYTAAPFVGWFMDAEIGVRDLADEARYNVLPQLVTALGWLSSEQDLERAPEHERLALLCKAQAELNYAVYHSFATAGVNMTDTLSASSMYSNFDDEHFRDKGFRLPSNPYWLAPPQGSIVPIWHRGGSPNYQPMPMICRNSQDPVKAWRRELTKRQLTSCPFSTPHCEDMPASINCQQKKAAIHILYCTAASTSRKLAQDLEARLLKAVRADTANDFSIMSSKVLNDFAPHKVGLHDVVLVVASTAGRGDVPPNGNKFKHNLMATAHKNPFMFSIFGNGNTSYRETYNVCAKLVKQKLLDFGAKPLDDGLFNGDTRMEDPPWDQFDEWVRGVLANLSLAPGSAAEVSHTATQYRSDCPSDFHEVKLISSGHRYHSGIQHVVLDTGKLDYQALSHVAIIPPNDTRSVKRALQHLGLSGNERIEGRGGITARDFLTGFVDFERPFKNPEWASMTGLSATKTDMIAKMTLREALPLLSRSWKRSVLLDDLFSTMPLITPRMFSVASSHQHKWDCSAHRLELLVQSRSDGRVSKFLDAASPGAILRLKCVETDMEAMLKDSSRPIICFATGSGLAPIRSLLQHRIAQQRSRCSEVDAAARAVAPITLILGFRQSDTAVIANAIRGALATGLVDILLLTLSNPEKVRAQDRIFDSAVRDRIEAKLKTQQASVYVCAGAAAADGFSANLNALVGCDVQTALGSRYVQEVYKPAC